VSNDSNKYRPGGSEGVRGRAAAGGLVLTALILVAAVANVALPDSLPKLPPGWEQRDIT
jgi:hypothetical protein